METTQPSESPQENGVKPLGGERFTNALKLRRLIRSIPPEENRRDFKYDRRLLPNDYLRQVETGVDNVEAAMPLTGITCGYPSWNLLYFSLLSSLKPEAVVIETGTHRGFSTIVLAQALRDGGLGGIVNTVDIDQPLSSIARENVTRANLSEFVRFVVSDSILFLKSFVEQTPRIDFAFLDGDHSYHQVLGEFEAIREKVAGCGGKVFFDNAANGGVREVLDHIRKTYGGNQVEFANCSWGPHGNVIWQA